MAVNVLLQLIVNPSKSTKKALSYNPWEITSMYWSGGVQALKHSIPYGFNKIWSHSRKFLPHQKKKKAAICLVQSRDMHFNFSGCVSEVAEMLCKPLWEAVKNDPRDLVFKSTASGNVKYQLTTLIVRNGNLERKCISKFPFVFPPLPTFTHG